MRRTFWLLLRLGIGVIGAYLLLRIVAVAALGYPWTDMDWDADGFTSPSDLLRASDIGRHEVTQDGLTCLEYFALKDGLPVKVVCPRR